MLGCRRRQKENQEDLLKKVNDETLRQLTKQKEDGGPSSGGGRKVSEVTSYRSLKDIPQYREMAIQVPLQTRKSPDQRHSELPRRCTMGAKGRE